MEDARSLVRGKRASHIPPVPASLADVEIFLSNPKWISWTLSARSTSSRFFLQNVCHGGCTATVFFSSLVPPCLLERPLGDFHISSLPGKPMRTPTSNTLIISADVEVQEQMQV